MNEGNLKVFLFLPQPTEGQELTDSFIAVKHAQISGEIAEKAERVSRYGVIFTTTLDTFEVREKLRMKDSPYLLIELTGNITTASIAGFFPDTDIEELKSLNLEKLKDSAQWLEKELDKAVERQDFERAAKIRDELKKKNEQ